MKKTFFLLSFLLFNTFHPMLQQKKTSRKLKTLGYYRSSLEVLCCRIQHCLEQLKEFKEQTLTINKLTFYFYQDRLEKFLDKNPQLKNVTIHELVFTYPEEARQFYNFIFYPIQLQRTLNTMPEKQLLQARIESALNLSISYRKHELKMHKDLLIRLEKTK